MQCSGVGLDFGREEPDTPRVWEGGGMEVRGANTYVSNLHVVSLVTQLTLLTLLNFVSPRCAGNFKLCTSRR